MNDGLEILLVIGTFCLCVILARIFDPWIKKSALRRKSIFVAKQNAFVYQWAQGRGFQFRPEGNSQRIIERMEASPEKDFFRADLALHTEDDSLFVVGTSEERMIWFYQVKIVKKAEVERLKSPWQIHGRRRATFFGHTHPEFSGSTERAASQPAWCMEIQTVPIQHQVTVTRKKVQEGDVLTTESRDFEKTFDISGTQESDVLQLLDPAMMDLIMQCPADALEFSDQSVILYRFNRDISAELLEQTLQSGLAIARQVDQNYPKAKHA